MEVYKNAHESGVLLYDIGNNFIILEFADNKRYLYNYQQPGKKHVETMKQLAKQGSKLNTYINKHVRENYFERLK